MLRTQEEIDQLLNDLMEIIDRGATNVPGMSYEQGVEATVRWLSGDTDDHPLAP